jgi:DNA-binding XRE family transcriptional regulator
MTMNVLRQMTDSNSKKEKFAKLLLDWRTKHGWSREESAAKLGVSYRTLQ